MDAAAIEEELLALQSMCCVDGSECHLRISSSNSASGSQEFIEVTDIDIPSVSLPLSIRVNIKPYGLFLDFQDSDTQHAPTYIQFTLDIQMILESSQEENGGQKVSIIESKGLDCSALHTIQTSLTDTLTSTGSIVSVVCAAFELAETHNVPHGRCLFCLEDIGNQTSDAESLTVLDSCLHCVHSECFDQWFCWKQEQLQKTVSELYKDHNNNTVMVAKAMAAKGIRPIPKLTTPDGATMYILECPACRMPISSLQHSKSSDTRSRLSTKKMNHAAKSSTRDSLMHTSITQLPSDVQANIHQLQQKFASLRAIQKQNNGLII